MAQHLQSPALPPAAWTLLLFGINACLFGLYLCSAGALDPGLCGAILFYGGLGLLVCGLFDWRRDHYFGAVVGMAYGLFWLSLMGMILLPASGFGQPPGAAPMASYLGLWGLFTAILFAAGDHGGRRLQLALGLLLAGLLVLAIAELSTAPGLRILAGGFGLAAGLVAGYGGCRGLLAASRQPSALASGLQGRREP